MRMWGISPIFLCRKHLLGSHSEIHKHRHNFEKHHNIDGRLKPIVQIEPQNMKKSHDELVIEMLKRGYKHQSPYQQPDLSYLPKEYLEAEIDIEYNIKDLSDRCPECRKLLKNYSLLLGKDKL